MQAQSNDRTSFQADRFQSAFASIGQDDFGTHRSGVSRPIVFNRRSQASDDGEGAIRSGRFQADRFQSAFARLIDRVSDGVGGEVSRPIVFNRRSQELYKGDGPSAHQAFPGRSFSIGVRKETMLYEITH